MPGSELRSPRNAATTRSAILQSALGAFSHAGYDAVGVREIAAGAGVTAMLVNRYFGSKEGLFRAVVQHTMRTPTVLTGAILGCDEPARALAQALVSNTSGEEPLAGFLVMLHSLSSPVSTAITREETANHHLKSVEAIVHGERAAERAALVLSVVAGFQVMRQMVALPALTEGRPSALEAALTEVFAVLLGSERGGQ